MYSYSHSKNELTLYVTVVTGVDWRGEVETVETVRTVVWRLSRGAEKSEEGGGGVK